MRGRGAAVRLRQFVDFRTDRPCRADHSRIAIAGTATLSNTNQTSQLKATATLSIGGTQVVTEMATWQSSNPSVVTVSATGVVAAVGKGTATITATYQGASGTLAFASGMAETVAVMVSRIAVLADSNQTSELYACCGRQHRAAM